MYIVKFCVYIYIYTQSLSIYVILHPVSPYIPVPYWLVVFPGPIRTKALRPAFVGHAQLAARHVGQAPCSAETLEERPEIMARSR